MIDSEPALLRHNFACLLRLHNQPHLLPIWQNVYVREKHKNGRKNISKPLAWLLWHGKRCNCTLTIRSSFNKLIASWHLYWFAHFFYQRRQHTQTHACIQSFRMDIALRNTCGGSTAGRILNTQRAWRNGWKIFIYLFICLLLLLFCMF